MNTLYGLGQEAAGAPTGLWASIKNITGQLSSVGVSAAPALIAKVLAKKTVAKKAKKAVAAPTPSAPVYIPPPPAPKGLPGWVIPVAVGGVALVVVMVLMGRKKGS